MMSNDYWIRKEDVNRLITDRITLLKESMAHGKGLTNSIINLTALKGDLERLTCIKVGSVPEPTIWRRERR